MRVKKCKCGGKVKYDGDSCGHEWLTCNKCGFEVETYQCDSIEKVWNEKAIENDNHIV